MATGKENIGEKATVSAYIYAICVSVYLWILVRKFWWMAYNSPNSPIFPQPRFSQVQYQTLATVNVSYYEHDQASLIIINYSVVTS